MPTRCSIDGCSRPAVARGLCTKHWRRWKTHGDPRTTLLDRDHAAGCAVAGCERPYYARGLCKRHYERAKSAPAVRQGSGKPCRVDGCVRSHYARGFCVLHFARWRRYGNPLTVRRAKDHAPTCSVPGCTRPFKARGLCRAHYDETRTARLGTDGARETSGSPPAVGNATPLRCWAEGCAASPDPQTGLCPEHRRIAEDWEALADKLVVTCCIQGCGETIDPELFGWEYPCCPHHRRLVQEAMELDQWGITTDGLAYLGVPDWLDAKWIAAILGRDRESRPYLDRVYGDTPSFRIITATLGDLYPLLPALTASGSADTGLADAGARAEA
jgi:hypothetical protein